MKKRFRFAGIILFLFFAATGMAQDGMLSVEDIYSKGLYRIYYS
jgi:hypothetical protein